MASRTPMPMERLRSKTNEPTVTPSVVRIVAHFLLVEGGEGESKNVGEAQQ